MKQVVCINDKHQPLGAEVVEGQRYSVVSAFMNQAGQRVYLLDGITNEGRTRLGFLWFGYDAARFTDALVGSDMKYEVDYMLN